MPARSFGPSAGGSTRMRTGMRCTTFTQLPEAFCAGSTLKVAPEAGLMLSTEASKVMPG